MSVYLGMQTAVEEALKDLTVPNEVHCLIKTGGNTNVRLNSRDYTATSGEHTAVQIKPNVSVGGTTGITGLEISPRFASGIAGSKLVGAFIGFDIKGAAGGNLSSDARCVEAKMESASGSTRTIAGVATNLACMNSLHGSCTTGVFCINVHAAGGNLAWTGFLRAASSGAGGITVSANGMTKDPESDTEAGYITMYVGSTQYQIPFYAIA